MMRNTRTPFSDLAFGLEGIARKRLGPHARPLILIDSDTGEREILAQLCLHAARSPMFDDRQELFDALRVWIGSTTGVTDDEIVSDATALVLRNWTRPSSSRSFEAFCRRTLAGVIKDGRRRDSRDRKIIGRRSDERTDESRDGVETLVLRTGLPRSTAYRWLSEERVPSLVTERTNNYETALGLRLTTRHRRYVIDENRVAGAEELVMERERRRDLVSFLVAKRGITRRGARKWIRARLDKGQTLKEVIVEVLGKDGIRAVRGRSGL